MNILICGSSGQLGNEFKRLFSFGRSEIGPIPKVYDDANVFYTDSDDLDITDLDSVMAFFKEHDIDLAINCAAYTNVDGCEENENLAYNVNAIGPKNLALASAKYNSKLVQVSTDYVFDGIGNRDRNELDSVNPINAYGRTKLAGEQEVIKNCSRYFIVRTAWLYGYIGNNFVKTMLRLGRKLDELRVVDDQFGNPTSANDLAYEILKISQTENYGVYHCTNNGTCSWFEFASSIFSKAQMKNLKCLPCSSEEYSKLHPSTAQRPKFSSLRNKRLEDTIGDEMRPWDAALSNYLDNLSESELSNE